ncbi:2-phospho-L-lactate guanylyltransferase [Angustibacter sp. Root456]|uniref:2-phospho-L-lactate guanylyltransferase n=1 Tax=Angustibacter sp. Root456 TaxID=1736539 RepID=UPI001910B9DE|nr:2-phospho-L-lactate guanylyltransferase [Angustibacter sp. Root456]
MSQYAAPSPRHGWTLVLPVQSSTRAKSRLEVPAGVDRPRLARAIARDSLAAVRATSAVARVVVVTADDDLAAECAAAGDHVVRDSGRSLSDAVRRGVEVAQQLAADHPAAVLLADVPALTPDELAAALEQAASRQLAVVPDAEGSGSVLLSAARPGLLQPAFGGDSALRHEQRGAVRLDLDLPRLRRDVDTWAALTAAVALGVGPATAAALGGAVDLCPCGPAAGTAH